MDELKHLSATEEKNQGRGKCFFTSLYVHFEAVFPVTQKIETFEGNSLLFSYSFYSGSWYTIVSWLNQKGPFPLFTAQHQQAAMKVTQYKVVFIFPFCYMSNLPSLYSHTESSSIGANKLCIAQRQCRSRVWCCLPRLRWAKKTQNKTRRYNLFVVTMMAESTVSHCLSSIIHMSPFSLVWIGVDCIIGFT